MQSQLIFDEKEYLGYGLKLLDLDPTINEPPELVPTCARLLLHPDRWEAEEHLEFLYKYTCILFDRIDSEIYDRTSWELVCTILRSYP
jgi:hypothetical protein